MTLALLGIFIILFSNNLLWLSFILNLIILDSMAIVFIHDCPLTFLERKYLGYTSVSSRSDWLYQLDILYECTHDYEKQLELLINLWSIVAVKMLCIISMDMLSIQIKN